MRIMITKILAKIKGRAFQFKTQYLFMFTGTLKFIIKMCKMHRYLAFYFFLILIKIVSCEIQRVC